MADYKSSGSHSSGTLTSVSPLPESESVSSNSPPKTTHSDIKSDAKDSAVNPNTLQDGNSNNKQIPDVAEKEDSGLSSSKYSVYSGKRDYTRLSSDMHISTPPIPTAVNIHQFYPSIEHTFSKPNTEASNEDNQALEDTDDSNKGEQSSDSDLTKNEPKREVSEMRTVRFEDEGDERRELSDQWRDDTFASEPISAGESQTKESTQV